MNRYKAHQNLLSKFMLGLQKTYPLIRMFPRHVGLFYTRNGAPVKINRVGMADLWAIYPAHDTMIHLEYEIKSNSGRQTKEQKIWQNFVESNNGLYLIVNDDYNIAIQKTGEYLKQRGLI